MIAVAVAGAAVIGAVVWAMGPGAVWALHHIDSVHGMTGKDKAAAVDAIRGRILAIATGILGIVAVYYTARNAHVARRAQQHSEGVAREAQEASRLSHDLAVRTAERMAELTEQGQVTERYTKAIEQLGADNLHIRIGGIYALERIARDSARDHPTVIDVLAAFVRERSHDTDAHASEADPLDPDAVGRLRPDLQAAVTVIGRRDTTRDTDAVDLNRACLQHADLTGAILFNAELTRADLTDADLTDADLSQAILIYTTLSNALLSGTKLISAQLGGANMASAKLHTADLSGASLANANLSGAYLGDAVLSETTLFGADLTGANLSRAAMNWADLTGADLTGASLEDANLTGADLTDASLKNANLTGADLTNADLHFADLTGANLAAVVGADVAGAKGVPNAAPPTPGPEPGERSTGS